MERRGLLDVNREVFTSTDTNDISPKQLPHLSLTLPVSLCVAVILHFVSG